MPRDRQDRLISFYLKALSEVKEVNTADFRGKLPGFALLRTLQTLGAYGYRGIFERKPLFVKPIGAALANARQIAGELHESIALMTLPPLLDALQQKYDHPAQSPDKLTITICSFSYMHGLPDDPTGNGGGFIFDCRALPNPHRVEELRPLTGLDPGVRAWLDDQPEVSGFLDDCAALVAPSVKKYLGRGFTSLQVNFGCTGGKHRSVYCAERFAEKMHSSFDEVNIKIQHKNFE